MSGAYGLVYFFKKSRSPHNDFSGGHPHLLTVKEHHAKIKAAVEMEEILG